jgi:hypothetical protein
MPRTTDSERHGRLTELASLLRSAEATACRLVQYIGPDPLGKAVAVGDVVQEVEGILEEGSYVDWRMKERTLYLRVWEFGGTEPPWSSVFAEAPLE